jgi:hypothetical protein
VQGKLRAELDRAPAGDVRLISLCAGQGRDVIGALTRHPRRDDVRARLVELDGRNVALARQAARAVAVGAHRLTGEPAPLVLGQRLFTFRGECESGPR